MSLTISRRNIKNTIRKSCCISTGFRFIKSSTASCGAICFVFEMWRHGQLAKDNRQLLTLVHGVDRKGRPMIKAYTGNSRHPIYQEYQDVIDKHYQKAVRLSSSSRTTCSPCRVNNSCFDYYSESGSVSTPRTRAATRWTPSLSGSSGTSSPIIPDLRGMRARISRLRCSLAIHAGLGGTNKELTFLPVIPVRIRKQPTADCPKMGCTKVKPPLKKLDLEEESRKERSNSVRRPIASTSRNTDCCQGCKGRTCSKTKKKKKRAKKNDNLKLKLLTV